MNSKTSTSLTRIGLVLFVLLFVFFLYTFLHESGHALAGAYFGQTLTGFDVSFWDLSAHVGLAGGALTDSQLAVQSIAGVSLPVIVWAIFISLVPRKASFTLEILKLLSSMTVVNTLLPWIVLPFLFLLGNPPPDDVTNFLHYSEMPPVLLAFTAAVLYAGGWVLFLSKINGLRNELLLFTTTEPAALTIGVKKTLPILTGIVAVCAIAAVGLNRIAAGNPVLTGTPPQGFSQVAHIELSRFAYTSESLTEFELDEPADVGVFVAVQDIDTSYFDLCICGSAGFKSTVLHGEGYRAEHDGGLWQETLPAGTYRIVLTSHKSPGTASIYLMVR